MSTHAHYKTLTLHGPTPRACLFLQTLSLCLPTQPHCQASCLPTGKAVPSSGPLPQPRHSQVLLPPVNSLSRRPLPRASPPVHPLLHLTSEDSWLTWKGTPCGLLIICPVPPHCALKRAGPPSVSAEQRRADPGTKSQPVTDPC